MLKFLYSARKLSRLDILKDKKTPNITDNKQKNATENCAQPFQDRKWKIILDSRVLTQSHLGSEQT
jgi:hypothetical protein